MAQHSFGYGKIICKHLVQEGVSQINYHVKQTEPTILRVKFNPAAATCSLCLHIERSRKCSPIYSCRGNNDFIQFAV